MSNQHFVTTIALRLALEALNTTESDCGSRAWEREQEAITALREALAKPDFWEGYVPEPVKPAPMSEPNRVVAYAASSKLHDLGYRWLGGEWVQPAQSTADKSELETVPAKGGLMPAPAITPEQLLALAQTASLGLDKVIEAFKMAAPVQPAPVQIDQSSANPGWCNGCTPDNCHGCEGRYVGIDGFEQPAQQEPVAWMSDRAVGFIKSEFGATPTVPLYTSPPAQRKPMPDFSPIFSGIKEKNQ